MTHKQKTKLSKFLSLVLRHKPEAIGIVLDEQGWAKTDDILTGLRQHFADVSLSVLTEIVTEDEKQRYSFNATGHMIRANQGHSLDVDLGLTESDPPEQLFHGTAEKTIWMIRRDGLLPMQRQYVHLSNDRDTAANVGRRHGEPHVIIVRSGDMARAGIPFYRSENGVWLVYHVPTQYLIFEGDSNETSAD